MRRVAAVLAAVTSALALMQAPASATVADELLLLSDNNAQVTAVQGDLVRVRLRAVWWSYVGPTETEETTPCWTVPQVTDESVLSPNGPGSCTVTAMATPGEYQEVTVRDFTAAAAGTVTIQSTTTTRERCGSDIKCPTWTKLDVWRAYVTVQVPAVSSVSRRRCSGESPQGPAVDEQVHRVVGCDHQRER